jgi:hypothetical protein
MVIEYGTNLLDGKSIYRQSGRDCMFKINSLSLSRSRGMLNTPQLAPAFYI